MSTPLEKSVLVLLASGLSRRYGERDKLGEKLAGKLLVDHAADVLATLNPLARIAVCPENSAILNQRLQGRFVIAPNAEQDRGLGHSIALGMKAARPYFPEAVVFCMGDMPFIEPDQIAGLLEQVGGVRGFDIVHSGGAHGPRPPAAFHAICFPDIELLDGDDGARSLLSDPRRSILGTAAPAPLLQDVDTKEDFALAEKMMAIRARHGAAPV